jgi:Two component regulator propeller
LQLYPAWITALICWLGIVSSLARAGTFPQLVSTRYDRNGPLPSGAEKPRVVLEEADPRSLPEGAVVRATARAAGGRVWILTDRGPFRSTATGFEPLESGPRRLEPRQPAVRGGARITALASDRSGHIWVGTDRGVYITNGEDWWQRLGGADGVPNESITCLHIAPGGDVWAGTSEGAWRLRDGHFRYFWGRRWLCDNDVQAIWTDRSGRAWIETKTGLACIEEKPMTLAEKAVHYESIIQQRHNRRGYIAALDLQTPGNVASGGVFEVSDNDGLWTSLYVAAMSLRFAAKKDPAARAQAQRSLNALLDLERLSGIAGFPARAVVTDDEIRAGVHGFNPEAKVHALGETAKAWYRSTKQPGLWCKGDTSSDELDGHYFAWYLYHDLAADDAEKAEIAAVARRVTDGIIANHYTLVDHTGRKTRWGIWSPELINHDPRYAGLRPLNSIEILAYLKVAEHITGDRKYAAAADKLIGEHHYLLNSLLVRRGEGAVWSRINHSDDELLYIVYYTLLSLEKDAARRRILTESMARTWEGAVTEQSIAAEHNPFYNFIFGATTGRACDVDGARATLRDWPWDLVSWSSKNSHRHDVSVKAAQGPRRNRVQLDRVLSPAERSQARWNANPWKADWGNDGRVEDDGVAWLVAYWLGVYHGFLAGGE